nr:MAG TPA: hypothetical protein [Caudoviricetes sp.]
MHSSAFTLGKYCGFFPNKNRPVLPAPSGRT